MAATRRGDLTGVTPTDAPPALPAEARAAVLAWYDERGRDLSFRRTRDPYAVLVSEVMAQQTQISRVVEAWSRFLERFPDVASLARATPADVVRAWQGMGYDRRALNLQRAARAIVADHGGRVPSEIAELERLPGVGPYTARAVASIAFGAPVGAVDTNVRRVLGRVLAGAAEAGLGSWLQAAADLAVDEGRPGDWTHAVMDLGATVCRPRSPRCDECPLEAWCWFAQQGVAGGAGAPPPRAASMPPTTPFKLTTRWLRGRIVDRLRGVDGADWTRLGEPIGDHDATAVRQAIAALARDGIVEIGGHPDEVRLATS
jgi:A/G-specific adenine glycosylase